VPGISRHMLVAISGWGSRIVGAIVQIALIRTLTRSLGADHYAAFAVLYSLSGWWLMADFGLGYSLQNHISYCRAHERIYHRLLARGLDIAFALLVSEALLMLAFSHVGGNALLRQFAFLTPTEKTVDFLVSGLLLLLVGVSQIAYRVWYGEQKGWLSNILPAVAQVVGLLLVYVSIHRNGGILGVILAYQGPPAVIGAVSLIYLRLNCRRIEDPVDVCPMLRQAVSFGGFGVAAAFVLQIDMPIVGQMLPPSQIAAYAVVSRIFGFAFLIFTSALQALWPVCAEQLALRHWRPVFWHMRRYILGGWVFVLLFSFLMLWKIDILIRILAPGVRLESSATLILAFCGLYVARIWTDTWAMVLQSRAQLLPLWMSTPMQAVASLVLQMYLIPRIGMSGAAWGMAGSFVLTAAWVLPWRLLRVSRYEMRHGVAQEAA